MSCEKRVQDRGDNRRTIRFSDKVYNANSVASDEGLSRNCDAMYELGGMLNRNRGQREGRTPTPCRDVVTRGARQAPGFYGGPATKSESDFGGKSEPQRSRKIRKAADDSQIIALIIRHVVHHQSSVTGGGSTTVILLLVASLSSASPTFNSTPSSMSLATKKRIVCVSWDRVASIGACNIYTA